MVESKQTGSPTMHSKEFPKSNKAGQAGGLTSPSEVILKCFLPLAGIPCSELGVCDAHLLKYKLGEAAGQSLSDQIDKQVYLKY